MHYICQPPLSTGPEAHATTGAGTGLETRRLCPLLVHVVLALLARFKDRREAVSACEELIAPGQCCIRHTAVTLQMHTELEEYNIRISIEGTGWGKLHNGGI